MPEEEGVVVLLVWVVVISEIRCVSSRGGDITFDIRFVGKVKVPEVDLDEDGKEERDCLET